ncbi:MAG: LacI family transcriptional regulator [Clostridiales bacterium]|jgi:LacI family transcriptional regulator|nr:LacI family transcriptional regulator [Clostridiales bacterium]
MKKINSTEIARLAGVSRSTVSRVVNGYSNVPDSTRERVMKVIAEHEYYPLLSGQLLAGKRSGTLGFFWVSNGTIHCDMLSSSFFVYVTENAANNGYLLLSGILPNFTDEINRNWVKRIFMQERIDGGIFVGASNNSPLIDELVAKGKIVGVFDYHHPDVNVSNLITVNFENDTGAKVIDYLVGLGHKKIAIIDGNMNNYSSLKRHEGFISSMQRHNIPLHRGWMIYADVTEQSGYIACKELMASAKELPTAIAVNNDSCALGVCAALDEAGISIPQQISVIGIDGHPRGRYQAPPLTTFEFDFNALFRSLVSRTIAAIEKEPVETTEFIPSKLTERCSCRRIG